MAILNRFLVLFEGRSGSTYLKEALGSHPNIIARGEKIANMRRGEQQHDWVKQLYTQNFDSSLEAVGFKTKLSDVLDPREFQIILRDLNCRVVHLVRLNVVKQVISMMRGELIFETTGKWNIYNPDEAIPAISLDVDNFLIRLRKTELRRKKLYDFVREIDLPVLRIYYEQLLVQPDPTFRRILRFLDVSEQELRAQTQKNTNDDLRMIVSNFTELRACVTEQRYQSMFDEVIVEV